jgi:hypothetical protein
VPSKRAAAGAHEATAPSKLAKGGGTTKAQPNREAAANVSTGAQPKKEAAATHGKYGLPPDPEAEIQVISGRPFWFYINDKGEEVTVVCYFQVTKTR